MCTLRRRRRRRRRRGGGGEEEEEEEELCTCMSCMVSVDTDALRTYHGKTY
jgi:hypothetical protein